MKHVKFILIVVCIWSCTTSAREQNTQILAKPVPATSVKVVLASIKPFEYLISTSGKIASSGDVRIQFKRAGIVDKILVHNGETVVQGQLLVQLLRESQELALKKVNVLLKEKKLSYDDQLIYVNIQDSSRYKLIEENIRILSGLAAAEVSFQEAKLEYDNSFIRAQTSGIVSDMDMHEGSPVNQNDLFCFIHDPVNLTAAVEVLESDALLLSKGQPAEIYPIAKTNKVYTGQVETINPRVDEKTGLVKVVLRLQAKSEGIPGMNIRAVIRLPYTKNIVIPKEAIIMRSGKPVVFSYENGLAKWNYVILGRDNGKEVEIISGLRENDQVITSNNLQLAHDAVVEVSE